MEKLAELLDFTDGYIGLIERGDRGAAPLTLFKLADIFGIPIDRLIYQKKNSYQQPKADRNQQMKKIKDITSGYTDKEMKSVVKTVEILHHMKLSGRGISNKENNN